MDIIIIVLLILLSGLTAFNLFISLKKQTPSEISVDIEKKFNILGIALKEVELSLREEFKSNRDESSKASRENRDELTKSSKENRDEQRKSLKSFEESFEQNVKRFNDRQREQFEDLSKRQNDIRQSIDKQLKEIREETEKKLEDMRKTVDENLKDTVEKRFNDSFKLISERLDKVHQGLGEMQQLASGVGDLKKVLTNVKTRGTLGEVQLGSILEQILSPWQYKDQAQVKENSQERVDYVVKLPDKNSMDKELLLPIDSKFPTEDYQRLLDAYDIMLTDDEMKKVSTAFENSVKKCAKDICEKYINPPITTDFAIMFVPTESLYADIIRRVELFETIQRTYKITVVGPTNLAAFLNSLQMGFRTLAIEQRSNDVWQVLGEVKREFGNFSGVIDKIKGKLDSAVKEAEKFGTRSKAIERKLRTVEVLPAGQDEALFEETSESSDILVEND